MRRVVLCLASLSLFVAAPGFAENRTEAIPLKFIPATEVERIIDGGSFTGGPLGTIGGGGAVEEFELLPEDQPVRAPGGVVSVIPAGITAWAVDTRANQLWVTGTPEGIEQLKQITRLLDVPARRLRISIQPVPSGPVVRQVMDKQPHAVGVERLRVISLTPAERKTLQQVAPSASLPAENNRPIRLRVPGKAVGSGKTLTLLPRVNGDQSITLTVPGRRLRDGKTEWALIALQRVPSGGSVLLAGEALAEPVLLTVEALPEKD